MSKLPRNVKLDITREIPNKWDVIELMDILKRELIARERCDQFESLSYHEDNSSTEAFSTLQIDLQKNLRVHIANEVTHHINAI